MSERKPPAMKQRNADDPPVLIVVPTLGRRVPYLRDTLASIRAQGVPVQVVVVAPQEATEARDLARTFGAEVLHDPGSMSAAINEGIAHAGPAVRYVNWLGDDDLLAPGSLPSAMDALEANGGAVVAFGHCQYIDPHGRPLWVNKAGRLAPWLMTWGPDLVPQPGMLVRLTAWREAGGLDADLGFAMDLDLLLRLRRLGSFVLVPRILSSFRWHPGSLTVSSREDSLDEAESVKRRYASRWSGVIIAALDPLVRYATRMAADRISRRAEAIA